MGVSAHSKLGASSAYRWMNCPGSVALAESLPEQEAGPAAREGTKAHAWAEFALKNGEVSLIDYVGAECPDPTLAEFSPLARDMAEAVDVYLDEVWRVLEPDDELYVEQRLSLEFVAPEMFGTTDCEVYKPATATLYIFDYKHGAGKWVPIEGNAQAKYYALASLQKHLALGHRVDRIVCGIIQPRCGDGEPRYAEFSPLDLWEFGAELREAAERTRQPNAPRCPGKHCDFCPGAKGFCLEFKKQALAVATDSFDEVLPPEFIPHMSADEMGKRLAQVDLLKVFLARFEEHAYAEAKAGNMPTGFKFVAGRGRRYWAKDDAQIIADAQEKTGVDISQTKALSPAQAEKSIGKKRFADLSGLVVTRYSKPTLVKESDKRPAMSISEVNGADAFDAIEAPTE